MLHKLTILSGLIIATTCTILPHIPIQVPILIQYPTRVDEPNYSFSYNINDERTGDVKNQQESKNGGIVTGQYSLIQPDGIRRTVDYRADDVRGFRATVNNDNLNRQQDDNNARDVPKWPQNIPTASPEPVAARSSIVQTINRHRIVNPWI